ncbi:MAG: hypothetical protein JW847_09445 [Candidatus Omnitrophica bacterium]|nr:hypothetical protein [Candidatus Omnitrophota bacterium]
MKRFVAFILIFILIFCSKGFCQELKGKRDGIHKEFNENGTRKLQYAVKNEQLDGFYEKFDENGELEYRQYYTQGVFDGVDRENYYYPLFFWYRHFRGGGQELLLSEQEAVKMFSEGYELADEPLEGDGMGIVQTRLPTKEDNGKKYPVTLTGISKNYIYLTEYKDKGQVEPQRHYYCDVIRRFKVPRSYDVDGLFNADVIQEVFQRRHTGVEFGTPFGTRKQKGESRLWAVQQYLGEPDYVSPLKPAGWFDVYYEFQDLHIVGHNSAVYFMEEGRPEWAKSPNYRNPKK